MGFTCLILVGLIFLAWWVPNRGLANIHPNLPNIVGIIVDEVKEIVRVEESDFEAAPKALSNLRQKFLGGIAKIDSRIIMLLDLEKVLSVDELKQTIN